jgi:hypothetical protein
VGPLTAQCAQPSKLALPAEHARSSVARRHVDESHRARGDVEPRQRRNRANSPAQADDSGDDTRLGMVPGLDTKVVGHPKGRGVSPRTGADNMAGQGRSQDIPRCSTLTPPLAAPGQFRRPDGPYAPGREHHRNRSAKLVSTTTTDQVRTLCGRFRAREIDTGRGPAAGIVECCE